MGANQSTTINPPIDVYDDIMVIDPVDNTVGFVAEGVSDTEGKWSKAADTREGDSLWAWIPNGSKLTVEAVKKHGWLIKGHMPLYYNGLWLIIGLRPGIYSYKLGIKDQARIEIINKVFIINGITKIKGNEISNKTFIENYLPKKKENISNSAKEKIAQIFKTRKDTDPIIQIKMLFPLIELTDKMFKKMPNKQAFKNYIYRMASLLDTQIKSYHLFTYKDERIKTLDGEPVDRDYAKIMAAPAGDGYEFINLSNKAGLLINIDKKISDGEREYLKKMCYFTAPIVAYITGDKS
jgi:hypothetical protein